MKANEFMDEMAAVLIDNGFEEDEAAEGYGRTFRNFATLYLEEHGGEVCLTLSSQYFIWEDSKAVELVLPKDCWESRGFRRLIADMSVRFDEGISI